MQNASRVTRRHDVRLERDDPLGFAIAKLARGIRLNEIINSRRAATDRCFRNVHQLEARNLDQQRTGLGAHALGVLKMAGLVKSNTQRERPALRARPEFRQNFAHVLAFARKAPGFFGVNGIVTKQVAVFLDA